MPQFVRHGPVVPDKLVQDLEDDRVVIFCGAGISMGAGLPDYIGLVRHCYSELSEAAPDEKAHDWNWPDQMLGALQSRYSSGHVRTIVTERLSRRPRSLALHRAILRLARLRQRDGLRLVTTNFDSYFEKARKRLRLPYDSHAAPILPIPRNDRLASWRSLVYLHGRLATPPTEHLVLTSADFGRAYLTDGWAARFVARLFTEFTVLFVGYSLNDPVMRYMVDAFAAEDSEVRFGPARGPAYIFVAHEEGKQPDPGPFRSRNLQPIFYSSARQHQALKQTILAWADARDDYLGNVARLVSDIAPRQPDVIDPTATANLVWAVIGRPEDSGYGARVFAEVKELPPIEWLDAFEQRETELEGAHAVARADAEQAARLSPPPPILNVKTLFPSIGGIAQWPTYTGEALIAWLVRHLGSEGLVERVVDRLAAGRIPHPRLRQVIRQTLAAAQDLPTGYRRFWLIVTSEGNWLATGERRRDGAAAAVRAALAADIDSEWLRQEVMCSLQPMLSFSRSSYRQYLEATGDGHDRVVIGAKLSELARTEIVLRDGDQVRSMVKAIDGRIEGDAFWASMVDDLSSLLTQALRLAAITGQATKASDPSEVQRPSVEPHPQNYVHQQWTILFDLLWRAWTRVDAEDPIRSRHVVFGWRVVPFLAFQRLVMAAMNHSKHFSIEEQLETLLDG